MMTVEAKEIKGEALLIAAEAHLHWGNVSIYFHLLE